MCLSGPFNCPFLVLSFSQVLILSICYALKQTAEIFAAFRSISQHFAPDPEKKDVQSNNFLKLNGPELPETNSCINLQSVI